MLAGLVTPSAAGLPAYLDALARGWSPATIRSEAVAADHRQQIATDPAAFLASLDDPHAQGARVPLPDGATVPRLPGFTRWVWADGFCGSISFRWQHGTAALPPHVLGHIGYSIVPWRRGEGHARRALALLLPVARGHGLPFVELTTDPENIASQRVILACGGFLVERFSKPAAYGEVDGLRFRISLAKGT